jgi:hypothetical protein
LILRYESFIYGYDSKTLVAAFYCHFTSYRMLQPPAGYHLRICQEISCAVS